METSVQTKEGTLSLLEEHEEQIRGFGVRRLGLFGSFSRGEQDATSDIDFVVEFRGREKTFDNFYRLAVFLEEVLQRPVELVTPESLSPYIGPHILGDVEYASFLS